MPKPSHTSRKNRREPTRSPVPRNRQPATTPAATGHARVEPYVRVACHLQPKSGAQAIRACAAALAPAALRPLLGTVPLPRIHELRRQSPANTAAYHSLFASLLDLLVSANGWKFRIAGDCLTFQVPGGNRATRQRAGDFPPGISRAVCMAQRARRAILFYFLDQHCPAASKELRRIADDDAGAFNRLAVVVAPTDEAARKLRSPGKAANFPRALFTSFEELRRVADIVAPERWGNLCAPLATAAPQAKVAEGSIRSFAAKVLANQQIGGKDGAYFKLAFTAGGLDDVLPAQFVMMDPSPARKLLLGRAANRKHLAGTIDLDPQPILKRPFGIYRTLHAGFAADCLRKLRLPQALAFALHPVDPQRFDLLYKVLPDGIGTPLDDQTQAARHDPHGRAARHSVRRAQPVRHDIPGGARDRRRRRHGTAGPVRASPPLPLDPRQGLRRHLRTSSTLRYDRAPQQVRATRPRAAYLYIDDLIDAGVDQRDIYVSCDTGMPAKIPRSMPAANVFHGFVPEQYRQFLAKRQATGQILAFTCGPNRMMEAMTDVCRRCRGAVEGSVRKTDGLRHRRLFLVRAESAAAPTARKNTRAFAREGPVFDAGDILWKSNDSKQPSARLRLRSPLLTASGTSGSGDEAGRLAQRQARSSTALGAFVTKAVTLEPRNGNPEPRIIETRAGILNSIGLQNKGADRFLKEDLPKLLRYERPVIVNISANAVEEYGELAARLLDGDDGQISGLEINVSCPNIKEGGVSFGIDPRTVERDRARRQEGHPARPGRVPSSPSSRPTSPTSPRPPKPPSPAAPTRCR